MRQWRHFQASIRALISEWDDHGILQATIDCRLGDGASAPRFFSSTRFDLIFQPKSKRLAPSRGLIVDRPDHRAPAESSAAFISFDSFVASRQQRESAAEVRGLYQQAGFPLSSPRPSPIRSEEIFKFRLPQTLDCCLYFDERNGLGIFRVTTTLLWSTCCCCCSIHSFNERAAAFRKLHPKAEISIDD